MRVSDYGSLTEVCFRPHGPEIGEVKTPAYLIFIAHVESTTWHDVVNVPLSTIVLHTHARLKLGCDKIHEFLEGTSK